VSRALLILVVASGCSKLLGFEGLAEPAPTDGRDPDSQITSDGPVDGATDPVCPASYTKVGTSSYRYVSNQAIPWLSAEDACVLDGTNTHLIVLDDDAERTTVQMVIDKNVWIGLSDRVTEGTFVPVTDQQTNYPPELGPPWAAGQPDNAGPNENCVQLLETTGELEDVACGNGRAYICECDGFPEDPSNL
jgi:hypothetical protein